MRLDKFIRAIKEKRNLDMDVFVMGSDGRCYEPIFVDTSVSPGWSYHPSSVVIVPVKHFDNDKEIVSFDKY